MPHSGEILGFVGTLRGEGEVFKTDNALYVGTPIALVDFLVDHLGNVLTDHVGNPLTD